ncbi:MAG: cell division protein FtsA [Lentisphaeria bacterium]|nr:cell division protein FtsA [Lentisphaeria bacterium]
MFSNQNIVCSVEFGTSKICVLVGELEADGKVRLLGYEAVPSANTVIKGEISDMKRVVGILHRAFDNAEKKSSCDLSRCSVITVVVTGGGIDSTQETAGVTVNTPNGIVTENEKRAVTEGARNLALTSGKEIINLCPSSFTLDQRRVSEPCGQSGKYLAADVHVVSANSRRLNPFIQALRETGFEDVDIEPVFAPLADVNGAVDDDAQEPGFILLDIGAGTTEYLLNIDEGIRASGVVRVGMEHAANDLAIGLSLSIDQCRRFFTDGILMNAIRNEQEFIEVQVRPRHIRKIPVSSCEAIVDARLRELISVVHSKVSANGNLNTLGAGGLLTGGGALYAPVKDIFTSVFDISCRTVAPRNTRFGALENPRFSAVWGALTLAPDFVETPARNSRIQEFLKRFSWGSRG